MKLTGFIVAGLLMACIACAQDTAAVRYIKVPEGYFMVLQPGDTIIRQLEALALKEAIPSAHFTGLGFAEVTFGFFDHRTKQFRPRHFKAGELAAMEGSLAWQNGKPSVHAHGVITDKKFRARGGHMLNAIVGEGTLEIMIHVLDKRLERVKLASVGANAICLDRCGQ